MLQLILLEPSQKWELPNSLISVDWYKLHSVSDELCFIYLVLYQSTKTLTCSLICLNRTKKLMYLFAIFTV